MICSPGLFSVVALSSLLEALAAVNRSVVGGLEGYLCLTTTVSANSCEVFTGRLVCILSCIAASLAAFRLVLLHQLLLLLRTLLFPRFVKWYFALRRTLTVTFDENQRSF